MNWQGNGWAFNFGWWNQTKHSLKIQLIIEWLRLPKNTARERLCSIILHSISNFAAQRLKISTSINKIQIHKRMVVEPLACRKTTFALCWEVAIHIHILGHWLHHIRVCIYPSLLLYYYPSCCSNRHICVFAAALALFSTGQLPHSFCELLNILLNNLHLLHAPKSEYDCSCESVRVQFSG